MTPHDNQPRDEQPREPDRSGGDGVVADDVEPAATPSAPVPGPDNERVWYPL